MLSASPIDNSGFYDIPIHNELSNKEIRDKPIYTNEYILNRNINLTVNDNSGLYKVFQDPTVPSPSLYTETDQPMSGYYYKDPMNLSFEVPITTKKNSKIYNYINTDLNPSLGIEKFGTFGITSPNSTENANFSNNTVYENNKTHVIFIWLIILLIAIFFFYK